MNCPSRAVPRSSILVGLFCLLTGALYAADQPITPAVGDSLRIETVVSQVLKTNDQAAAARYMEQSAAAKIAPAGAWDDPMLMLGVVNLPTDFKFNEDMMTMKMVGLSQKIPYAGQNGLEKKAARAEADASSANREETERELVLSAKLAFYDWYFPSRMIDDMKAQRALMADMVSSATAGLTADQSGQADVAMAQSELWRMDAEILSMEQMVDESRYMLCALMGLPTDTKLPSPAQPPTAVIPDTPNDWITAADANYPVLKKMDYQAIGYGFSADAMRRMRWPMVELSASYGFRADMPMEEVKDMVGFQVSFSLPFFSGRRQNDMARSMDLMKLGMEAETSQMRREVEAEVRTLHAKARRLSQSLALYTERIIPADNDAWQSMLASYAAGRMMLSDILESAIRIYRDRVAARRQAYDLARTTAEVEKYISAAAMEK
ncbi:MAG: TolC family protein [candidate division Zixibacteria bacterium]|nr:TolC family protein [candidate division Zixibacteria bacterium]